MSKERTGQRHKNKIYFKDQELDLYLQAFPLNFQTYGGAATGEAFYAASRVNEKDLESWIHEWSALGARLEEQAATGPGEAQGERPRGLPACLHLLPDCHAVPAR